MNIKGLFTATAIGLATSGCSTIGYGEPDYPRRNYARETYRPQPEYRAAPQPRYDAGAAAAGAILGGVAGALLGGGNGGYYGGGAGFGGQLPPARNNIPYVDRYGNRGTYSAPGYSAPGAQTCVSGDRVFQTYGRCPTDQDYRFGPRF